MPTRERNKKLKSLAKVTIDKFNNPFDINDFQNLVRSGEIQNVSEIEIFIRECKSQIHNYKIEMEEYFYNKCEKHDYANWTYTNQKRIMKYVYVYQQKCNKCSHIVSEQVDEKSECPKGAENAIEQYYNNFI